MKVKPLKCLEMVRSHAILLCRRYCTRNHCCDSKCRIRNHQSGWWQEPCFLKYDHQKLETLIGKSGKIDHKSFHIADLMETWADIEKAKNLLRWEPKVSLDEGLKNLSIGTWKP